MGRSNRCFQVGVDVLWSWALKEHTMAGGPADGEDTEVLTRLGRNLILFQKAEHTLKWLAARQ